MVPALSLERPVQPILQIEVVRLAATLGHMKIVKIGDVNLEALVTVFVLQERLKFQQNCLFDLVAVVSSQNIKNNLFVLLDSTANSWAAIERSQALRKIQQSGYVYRRGHAQWTR